MVGLVPTTANAAPTGADPAIARSLQRISAGTWTADDIRQIKRDPALAKVVIDPSTVKVAVTGTGLDGRSAGGRSTDGIGTQATVCGWVEVTVSATTVLGFDFVKWLHHVSACNDGTNVTAITERYDRVVYADPTLYERELAANSLSGRPATVVVSVYQRHFEQCVIKYGCFSNYYPWSSIYLYGNGTYTYRWGVG